MKFVARLLINGFAVFITAYLLRGVYIDSFLTAIIVSVVLGIVNTLIKPILSFLALPLNILTFGLFNFVISGLMILLTSVIVPGFSVENIWWAVLFGFVLAIINWFFNLLTR